MWRGPTFCVALCKGSIYIDLPFNSCSILVNRWGIGIRDVNSIDLRTFGQHARESPSKQTSNF